MTNESALSSNSVLKRGKHGEPIAGSLLPHRGMPVAVVSVKRTATAAKAPTRSNNHKLTHRDIIGTTKGEMMNRFKDAENATELIHQVVGAGSVCWENPGGAGVFDDVAARQIADDGIERLGELLRAAKLT